MDKADFIKRWIRRFARSAVLCLLLLCVLFGLIQTNWGKTRIKTVLAAVLSGPGRNITAGTLSGFIPFEIVLDRLSIADHGGEWLSVEEISVRWSPLSLLHGYIRIDELSVGRVVLSRLPPEGVDKKTPQFNMPSWPARLCRIELIHLAVDRIRLGDAVAGQEVTFTLRGSQLIEPTDTVTLSTRLAIERLDEKDARINLVALMKEGPPHLTLLFKINDSGGGFMARALGFSTTGPLTLSLSGEGPLSRWHGRITSEVGGVPLLSGDITLSAQEKIQLSIKGAMSFAPHLVPVEMIPILGEETPFALSIEVVSDQYIVLRGLNLFSDQIQVEGNVLLRFKSQEIEGGLEIEVKDLGSLRPLVGRDMMGHLNAQCRFSGLFGEPQLEMSFLLDRGKLPDIAAARIQGTLLMEPVRSSHRQTFGLRVKSEGTIDELVLEEIPAFPEKHFTWSGDLDLHTDWEIPVRDLQVEGENLSVQFSGEMNPADTSIRLKGLLMATDLRPLSELTGTRLSGSARLRANITKPEGSHHMVVLVDGRLDELDAPSPYLSAVLGHDMTVQGRMELSGTKGWTVSELHLVTAGAKLKGQASWGMPEKRMEGTWHLDVPQLDIFSPALGYPVGGSVQLAGRIQGAGRQMQLSATAAGRALLAGGLQVQELVGSFEARGRPDRLSGRFEIGLDRIGLKLSSDFRLRGDRFVAESLSLESMGVQGAGRLDLDLKEKRLNGMLRGEAADLADFRPVIGYDVSGKAQFKIEFQPVDGNQRTSLLIQGEDLSLPVGRIAKSRLWADVEDPFHRPKGEIQIEANDLDVGWLRLKSVKLAAIGSDQNMAFTIHMLGDKPRHMDMKAQGQVDRQQIIEIDRLRGSYGEHPLGLARPARVEFRDKGMKLDHLTLKVGSGLIDVSGERGEEALALTIGLEQVPIDVFLLIWTKHLEGSSSGRISVRGRPDGPKVDLELKVSDLRYDAPIWRNLPPGILDVEGGFSGEVLTGEMVLENMTKNPITAKVVVPFRLDLSAYPIIEPSSGILHGRLNSDVDISRLSSLLHMPDQRFGGELAVDVVLGGTWNRPLFDIHGRVEKGFYENRYTGTILRNMEINLDSEGQRLVIEGGRARDDEAGTIQLRGWLDLNPDKEFPLEVVVTVKDAVLLGGEDIMASGAGQLRVTGSSARVQIESDLSLSPVRIGIPHNLHEGEPDR